MVIHHFLRYLGFWQTDERRCVAVDHLEAAQMFALVEDICKKDRPSKYLAWCHTVSSSRLEVVGDFHKSPGPGFKKFVLRFHYSDFVMKPSSPGIKFDLVVFQEREERILGKLWVCGSREGWSIDVKPFRFDNTYGFVQRP